MRIPSTGKAILIILGIIAALFLLPFVPTLIVWVVFLFGIAVALYLVWLIAVRVNSRATGRSGGRW